MITVAGGTYTEVCLDPAHRRVMGSGLRAAMVLRGRLERFCSFADATTAPAARASLRIGPELELSERPGEIGFIYDTPLSRPLMFGLSKPRQPLTVESETVLLMGMVEAEVSVNARVAVVDPQHSLPLAEIASRTNVDHLHIVLNSAEGRRLTGQASPSASASSLRRTLDAEAVVIKCGAIGAVVATESGTSILGAHATPHVHPIGSGDIFSAAYAAKVDEGATPLTAARFASYATAEICSSQQLAIPSQLGQHEALVVTEKDFVAGPVVYVAASFATTEQRWILRLVSDGLRALGATPFSPLVDVGPRSADASATFDADRAGVKTADALLLISNCARRGPFVEAGMAIEAGKPVVAFAQGEPPHAMTMIEGSGAVITDDLSTAVYKAIWSGVGLAQSPARHRG